MSMEVVSARSALLSNFEVLALLKELESEQLARQKTAIRIKKEEEERLASGQFDASASASDSGVVGTFVQEEVCENLRTVEFEAIRYLTADYLPTKQQNAESVTNLVRGLNKFDLTKAEKLQIVNLAPTEPVELYVIVEEIEDRFGEAMDQVLDVVRSSISTPLFLPSDYDSDAHDREEEQREQQQNRPDMHPTTSVLSVEAQEERVGWDNAEGHVEEVFDDLGAGAGVEGDLEMGDDNDE